MRSHDGLQEAIDQAELAAALLRETIALLDGADLIIAKQGGPELHMPASAKTLLHLAFDHADRWAAHFDEESARLKIKRAQLRSSD